MSELKFTAANPKARNRKYSGNIDRLSDGIIEGWAVNNKNPEEAVSLELLVNDQLVYAFETELLRSDIDGLDGAELECGFSVDLAECLESQAEALQSEGALPESVEVAIRIAGGDLLIGPSVLKVSLAGLLGDAPSPAVDTAPEVVIPPADMADMDEQEGEDATEDRPVFRAGAVVGNLDIVRGGLAQGWVCNRNQPDQHVPIELWVDGKLVALGVADVMRADLLNAGYGKGDHGFSLEIPKPFKDGKLHAVSIRESLTGSELPPGKLEYEFDMSIRSWIDGIQGASLVGWISREYPVVLGTNILVWEGNEVVAQGFADQPMESPDSARFYIPLPSRLFDGRVHRLVVRTENNESIGELTEALPYVLTPEDVLQQHGGAPLRGRLSNAAAQRYESLRYQFAQLAADKTIDVTTRERLAQVFDAHEQVMRGIGKSGKAQRDLPGLDFPEVAKPDVSVVIPVHNKFEVTYNCLASLVLSPNQASYEVIVVDDGSSDATVDIGEYVGGIAVLRNESAQGFVRSCNRGGAAARGRYVVMLNNDTEVGARWLDELLRVFEEQDRVGMSGAKLVYPNGVLQEAGGVVWNTGDPWNYGRGANPHDPRYNYVRDVDYLSGACIMLPKPLWDELGGFDQLFAPAYFEDTDLAFRVRAKGLRTVYTPFCEVVHFEGVSNGTEPSAGGMKRYQEINRPKFKKRHGPACYYNGAVGSDVELQKDRNIRYRVLVIDATTPTPDKDAGSYAAIQEMRLLRSFGCKLSFIPENAAYLGQYTEQLQRMGVECLYAPFAASPLEVLRARGPEFDLVYITRYTVAEKYIDPIREFAPNARIVFNNADLHFLREMRLAVATQDPDIMEQALRTRDAELAVMRDVDLTLSYNEVEHAVILSHNMDASVVAKCPWVVDLPETVPGFAARADIAFLGGYGHPPNAEAVQAFVHEVMPLLRKRLPGVRFLVYGSNPPKSLEALECEDVAIKGWVEDVAEVYNTCRVFIAPLKTGAGLKGKVVGAFAYGVPSVLSPVAAEGIGLRDGLEARIAAKPEAWAEAIAELYEDEARWKACSEAARRFAATEYSFERGRALMGEALAQVGVFAEQ